MADMNIVLEGSLKHRDGKKWKARWCVIRKLSPVADRLHITLYKDARDCYKNGQEKAILPLEEFFGIESCFTLDKEGHVMAIVCQREVTLLAFQSRETLIQWEIRIRSHLGEEHQYPMKLLKTPSSNKLQLGSVKLYIQGGRIGITANTPPRLLGSWNVVDIRKFGVVDSKFCFEAGSRCGKVAGVYVFLTEQGQEISDRMRQASQGKHSKSRRSSSSSNRRSQLSCHSVMSNMSSISGLSGFSSPPEVFGKDFRDMEVYADLNFMSEPSPLTGSSVETTSTIFSDSSSDSEKQKLVSIENLVAADRTSSGNIYDVPPQGVRKVSRTAGDMNSVNVSEVNVPRRLELTEANAMPKRTPRDELNISPELDNVDGCGMILDGEVVKIVNAEIGAESQPTKRRLESTTSSHSYTSGDSVSSVSISVGTSSGSSSGASTSSQPHLPPSTSTSDMDMFLTSPSVQRNVDILSPMVPNPEQSKVTGVLVGSGTGGGNRSSDGSNGSGSCLFESHGQLREPDTESLDLLDEVLRACNVDAFSSSSGGHSSSHGSTRDLCVRSIHSSTCSIGSANQTGEATSDSSSRTSPARASPARSSPSMTPVTIQPLPPPPPPPPPRPVFSQQASLPVSVDTTAKCHKHSYVNVCGINSGSNTGQSAPALQTVPFQQQHPQQTQLRPAEVKETADCSVSHRKTPSNPLNHDYVNIWNDEDVEGQSSPAMQQQHSQQPASSSVPFSQSDANLNPSMPRIPSVKSAFLDPSKPLPFVDLGRFDGKDEGYLYWVKATPQPTESPVILTDPELNDLKTEPKTCTEGGEYIQMKATGILNYIDSQVVSNQRKNIYTEVASQSPPNHSHALSADHQLDYVNMDPGSAKAVAAKLSAVRGKLLSYHGSLKRSKKPQVQPRGPPVEDLLRRSTSPKGSPKSDRNSLRTELFRSRGKSLENILDGISCASSGSAEAGRPFVSSHQGTCGVRTVQDDGDYVQLDTRKRNRSPVPTRTSPGIISQLNLSVPSTVLPGSGSLREENPYAVMSGAERTYALLESKESPFSCIEGTQNPYIQIGPQDVYVPRISPTNNPFTKSPSPLRSPRSLRRTPPTVSGVSPHTSPKKIRGHFVDSGDYMMMRGYPRDDDDSAIFCAMELPLRSSSLSSYNSPMRSRNCSFSSNTSSETYHGEESYSYMSMNLGRNRSNSNQSQRSMDRMARRPPLNQSRSLDTELEGGYLHMNLGSDGVKGNKHSDYMCMTPPGDDMSAGGSHDRGFPSAASIVKPLRPFEDLIEHDPFVTKKPVIPPKPAGLGRRPSSAGAASKPEDGIKSPPPGKRERFLSRLIRRNSSKERKCAQSKSQEDILSSPVAETLPEVPISEPNTPSPFSTRLPQDPFGLTGSPRLQRRRASVDVLSKVPGIGPEARGRSASYSCQGWTELANLTDEEKQQSCQSLASSSSSHHSHDAGVVTDQPPALPPRTYTKSKTSDLVDSPAYMLVMPTGKIKPDLPPPAPSPVSDILAISSEIYDILERPVSPNMPTEPAPPPPVYVPGIVPEAALSYTDSNPNSTNTSTLTLLHISEEDDMMPIPPPVLPEKTNRRKSSPGSMLGASLSLLRCPNARRSHSPTWHSQSELLLTDDSKASSASASPLTVPRSRRDARLTVHIPATEDEEELWTARNVSGTVGTSDDLQRSGQSRMKADSSESQSLSSYGSSDTTSTRSDDHKCSPASTTLRPRFGKEYKKLDRRKLADELNMSCTDGLRTPGSPSVASSVFTFDTMSLSSRMSSVSGHSYGNDSPRSPSLFRPGKDHDYVNVCMPRDRTDSPRFWDMTPPGSPRSLSGASEQSNPLLNYAEIDLSQTDDSVRPRKPVKSSDIEYAMIDMVATAAASRVGKEHAQLREDSLRRKDSRRGDDGSSEYIRRSKLERKNSSLSSSGRSDKKGSSSRSGSKDRKFSAPM